MTERRFPQSGPRTARPVMRTCIACRHRDDKATLFRVVSTPEGSVVGDCRGFAAGRGAYVCGRDCFERARSMRCFNRALRSPVTEDELDAIEQVLASWEQSQNRE